MLTFVEDPFAENDVEGYRTFQKNLREKFPQVHISKKFKDLQHLKQLTNWDMLTEAEAI